MAGRGPAVRAAGARSGSGLEAGATAATGSLSHTHPRGDAAVGSSGGRMVRAAAAGWRGPRWRAGGGSGGGLVLVLVHLVTLAFISSVFL